MKIRLQHKNILLNEWQKGIERDHYRRFVINSKFGGYVEIIRPAQGYFHNVVFVGCMTYLRDVYRQIYGDIGVPNDCRDYVEAQKHVDQFLIRSDKLLAFV